MVTRQKDDAAANQMAAMMGNPPPNPPGGVPAPAAAPAAAPAPAAPQAQPQPPGAPPPPPPPGEEKPTVDSKAEGQPSDNPVSYLIKDADGNDVSLSQDQMSGVYNRYQKMLGETSGMKPFVQFGSELMQRMPKGTTPDQALKAIMMALTKNPQMGAQQKPQPASQQPTGQDNADFSAQLEKWERENASTAPPGYKEMLGMMGNFQNQFGQMQGMMQQLLSNTAGQVDATRAGANANIQGAVSNRKQTIMNNLSRVQQHMGLTDDDFEPFMNFATSRGYTMPEFVDVELLAGVAADYKRAKEEPKLKRLEEISQRRQAYTEEPNAATMPRQGQNQGGGNTSIDRLLAKGGL